MSDAKERLPDERGGVAHHFVIISRAENGEAIEIDGYLHANVYPDGRLGEVFLQCGKEGQSQAMLSQWAIALSVGIQYGAPVEDFLRKFVGARFEPSGRTRSSEVPVCTSPVDYVARWLLLKCCGVDLRKAGS